MKVLVPVDYTLFGFLFICSTLDLHCLNSDVCKSVLMFLSAWTPQFCSPCLFLLFWFRSGMLLCCHSFPFWGVCFVLKECHVMQNTIDVFLINTFWSYMWRWTFWYAYQPVSKNAPTSLEVFSRSTSFLRNGFSFPNIVPGKINVSLNSLQKIIRKPLQIYSLNIDFF